jgi:hypothetical protein
MVPIRIFQLSRRSPKVQSSSAIRVAILVRILSPMSMEEELNPERRVNIGHRRILGRSPYRPPSACRGGAYRWKASVACGYHPRTRGCAERSNTS